MISLDEALKDVSTLFLDTTPVIYYTERISRYFPLARPFFHRIDAGEVTAVTPPLPWQNVWCIHTNKEIKHWPDSF